MFWLLRDAVLFCREMDKGLVGIAAWVRASYDEDNGFCDVDDDVRRCLPAVGMVNPAPER